MTKINKEEMEQIINRYEYERAYKITKEMMKEEIKKARIVINDLLDELEISVNDMMDTARTLKDGGVCLGKVWDLYANNPELSDYQTTKDHIKHLKNSKYPFEKILKVLESEK